MRPTRLIGSGCDRAADYEPPVPAPGASGALALDALYRTHASRLLRFFVRRAGHDDAGDLLHETFARLAGLGPVRAAAIERPEAYLGRTATNLLRDRARLAARRAAVEASSRAGEAGDAVDPHRLLEDRDALARLERALAQINPRRRAIFLRHRLEHCTYAEIAEDFGLSVKGVKKQMAKALVELRRAMAEDL